MKRRDFLKTLSTSAAAVGISAWIPDALAGLTASAGERRPNVLFIFSDMQRAYSMGCYGDANARTPQLDRFAAEGARFDAAMSNTPVCCPYRASLMTGQYAHHHGVMSNSVALAPKVKCLAETFREAGYATGYFGKWHIGAGGNRLGFPAEGPDGYYKTSHDVKPCADKTIDFIQRHGRSNMPWFCMLSWLPPHSPYAAGPGYAAHFKNVTLPPNVPQGVPADFARRALPDYYGMIEEIDSEFGRIMATLERTGVAQDTIVVYTSDHGDMIGCQGYGAKRWPHEESARVPLLIRYPRRIRPGTVVADPIGTPDLYPTLAGLAGVATPAGLDGMDYTGAVTGAGAAPRDYVYLEMAYAYVPWPGWRAMRTRKYSYARTGAGPWLLFDMEKDPFQMRNLVGDPAAAGLVEAMEQRLAVVMQETGDSWSLKSAKGDLENWLPGGSKQRGNYMGVSWPGCAVKEVGRRGGEEREGDGGGKKAGKKGGKKGGGGKKLKRKAKAGV